MLKYYDFHIHSALSPCADDTMTPFNICNMAKIKGLDVIGVCDHNSCRQLESVEHAANKVGIQLVYGAELQTIEEVHVLALFKEILDIRPFEDWLSSILPDVQNDATYFGHQYLFDHTDKVIGQENRLLLSSLPYTLDQVITQIHKYHGIAILAHALHRSNGIVNQLGFIPMDLKYDGIEVKDEMETQELFQSHPWILKNTLILHDSDAHQLVDIQERMYQIDMKRLEVLWEKYK